MVYYLKVKKKQKITLKNIMIFFGIDLIKKMMDYLKRILKNMINLKKI
jgi:hypothetical protein